MTYRRYRVVAWIVIALSIVVVVLVFRNHDDPGVVGCKMMQSEADRKLQGKPASIDSSTEYYDLYDKFAASEIEDVRISGTAYVGVSMGIALDRQLPDRLPIMDRQSSSNLLHTYTALIVACGNRDVPLPTIEELDRKVN